MVNDLTKTCNDSFLDKTSNLTQEQKTIMQMVGVSLFEKVKKKETAIKKREALFTSLLFQQYDELKYLQKLGVDLIDPKHKELILSFLQK